MAEISDEELAEHVYALAIISDEELAAEGYQELDRVVRLDANAGRAFTIPSGTYVSSRDQLERR